MELAWSGAGGVRAVAGRGHRQSSRSLEAELALGGAHAMEGPGRRPRRRSPRGEPAPAAGGALGRGHGGTSNYGRRTPDGYVAIVIL